MFYERLVKFRDVIRSHNVYVAEVAFEWRSDELL